MKGRRERPGGQSKGVRGGGGGGWQVVGSIYKRKGLGSSIYIYIYLGI